MNAHRTVNLLTCFVMLVLACLAVESALADSRPPSSYLTKNQMDATASTMPSDAALPDLDNAAAGDYQLGAGDEIKLTVYGEDDLSGTYTVSGAGMVALPLIGDVPAARQTPHELENAIRIKLAHGYLKNPRVSVAVAANRPFFILGEVAKPGGYPYLNGMTVLNAVALAGGYTYRADRDDIRIIHADENGTFEQEAREDDLLMPGDVVRVAERFF